MEHKSSEFSLLLKPELIYRGDFEAGLMCCCCGEYQKAVEHLERIAASYSRAYIFLDLIKQKYPEVVTIKLPSERELKFILGDIEIAAGQEGVAGKNAKYDLGLYYFVTSEYKKAVEQFLKIAHDDENAQFMLGLCYAQGKGVTKDWDEAASYFSKAANKGHAEAAFHLGLYLLDNKKEGELPAADWFEKALNQGHVDAAYYFALCTFTGRGGVAKL